MVLVILDLIFADLRKILGKEIKKNYEQHQESNYHKIPLFPAFE